MGDLKFLTTTRWWGPKDSQVWEYRWTDGYSEHLNLFFDGENPQKARCETPWDNESEGLYRMFEREGLSVGKMRDLLFTTLPFKSYRPHQPETTLSGLMFVTVSHKGRRSSFWGHPIHPEGTVQPYIPLSEEKGHSTIAYSYRGNTVLGMPLQRGRPSLREDYSLNMNLGSVLIFNGGSSITISGEHSWFFIRQALIYLLANPFDLQGLQEFLFKFLEETR